MIVIDSSVWIAHFRDLDTRVVRAPRSIEDPDDIIVGDVVLLEVLQGARDEAHAARIERNMRQFHVERMLDDALAVLAAGHHRTLRDHGITIRKTIDLVIGTFCIERCHVLLHDDRDFDPMAVHLGLRVV